MLNLLKILLNQVIKDIDSGNSNISELEQLETINFLQKISSQQLSKIESSKFIGVSRATFDNYIKEGKLPKGTKRAGFKELSWNKSDLINFINNQANE